MIETERLILRQYTIKDKKALTKMYGKNPRYWKYTRIPQPYKPKDALEFIRKAQRGYRNKESMYYAIVLKENQGVIGGISLHHIEWTEFSAQLGYTVDKKYLGQRIAHEAAEALIDYGLKKLLLNRIQISCATPNKASRRVIRRLHADFEGLAYETVMLHGKFYDEYRYSITKRRWKRKVLYKVR